MASAVLQASTSFISTMMMKNTASTAESHRTETAAFKPLHGNMFTAMGPTSAYTAAQPISAWAANTARQANTKNSAQPGSGETVSLHRNFFRPLDKPPVLIYL
jgi:hypothetical protein